MRCRKGRDKWRKNWEGKSVVNFGCYHVIYVIVLIAVQFSKKDGDGSLYLQEILCFYQIKCTCTYHICEVKTEQFLSLSVSVHLFNRNVQFFSLLR